LNRGIIESSRLLQISNTNKTDRVVVQTAVQLSGDSFDRPEPIESVPAGLKTIENCPTVASRKNSRHPLTELEATLLSASPI